MKKLNTKILFAIVATVIGTNVIASPPIFNLQNIYGVDYVADHFNIKSLGSGQPEIPSYSTNGQVRWESIDQDFKQMSKYYNTIRVYDLNLFNTGRVLRAAQRYHMKVIISIDWAFNTQDFNKSFSLFKYYFSLYPDLQKVVKGVIVGNEVLTTAMDNSSGIDGYMTDVNSVNTWVSNNWQDKTTLPFVTISERDGVLEGATHKDLIAKLPVNVPVFANVYPFWGGCTIQNAIADKASTNSHCAGNGGSFKERVVRLQTAVQAASSIQHPIIVGETGWPSSGDYYYEIDKVSGTLKQTPTPSDTHHGEQQLYTNYIHKQMEQNNIPEVKTIFDFMSYDQPLKGKNLPGNKTDVNNIRNYWGLWTDGSYLEPTSALKFSINTGMTTPLPAPSAPQGAFVNVAETGGEHSNLQVKIVSSAGSSKIYTYAQWHAASNLNSGYPWIGYGDTVQLIENSKVVDSNVLTSGHGLVSHNLVWQKQGVHTLSQVNWSNRAVDLPVKIAPPIPAGLVTVKIQPNPDAFDYFLTYTEPSTHLVTIYQPYDSKRLGTKAYDVKPGTEFSCSDPQSKQQGTNKISLDGTTWEKNITYPINFKNYDPSIKAFVIWV